MQPLQPASCAQADDVAPLRLGFSASIRLNPSSKRLPMSVCLAALRMASRRAATDTQKTLASRSSSPSSRSASVSAGVTPARKLFKGTLAFWPLLRSPPRARDYTRRTRPAQYGSRSVRLKILPVSSRGKASCSATTFGTL